jgi:2-polyprenyl-6-methoxyphenol hydroxylase-like FAD-dependent oxidoreductase
VIARATARVAESSNPGDLDGDEGATMSMTNGAKHGFGGGHAIVIGGSMAGLIATRVLANHFERVTLVERDAMPTGPEPRKGVPQMRHVHVLLKRGETILREFFPGIVDELEAAGSHLLDMAGDTRWYHFGGWKPRFRSGMEFLSQSRPLLEWKIRERVAATPRVTVRDGTDVHRYLADSSNGRVTGVRLQPKREGAPEEDLVADLVVDASGRGSRTPQWLGALGYAEPEETQIKVDIGYATALMKPPPNFKRDWKALFVYMRPPETRLGVLLPVENDRWLCTLVGWFGDHPPADPEGYLEWTRGLPVMEFYETIRDAEICSPIAIHKFPANRRRHYENLARFPDRLVVIGDALCSLNPIYGQGMTTGALGAATLDVTLSEQIGIACHGKLEGFARRFQRRLGRTIDAPWMTVLGEDFRYPQAEGKRPIWAKPMGWYTSRVYRLAREDEHVSRRFLEVMHLMEKPTVLFEPYVLRRVLTLGSEPATSLAVPPPAPAVRPA